MKLLIPVDKPDKASEISDRLGTAPYFLIVDPETMSAEPVMNPGSSGGQGAGMMGVALALEKGVDIVLTRYCSPMAKKYLTANGVKVVDGLDGMASDVIRRFVRRGLPSGEKGPPSYRERAVIAARQTLRQFAFMLPLILGLLGLLGLFNALVSQRALLSIFPGNGFLDTLAGACLGSISAGNPINSYIIGGALLKRGVSLLGITAFMVAWVSVGLIQLPAEIGALGARFAILRNLLSFFAAMVVAFLTVWSLGVFPGGIF